METSSVLFLIPEQFGYSAGYFYYCKYLLEAGYRIGVICVDQGRKRIELTGDIKFYYVRPKNFIHFRFALLSKLYELRNCYDTFVLKQFAFGLSVSSVFLPKKKRILDIRTGSVRCNKVWAKIENFDIKALTFFFRKIFILSDGLAEEFKIPKKKYTLLPLGADELSRNKKDYITAMKLLYVGTFFHRDIDKSISGFARFYQEYGDKIDLSFDIIGNGYESDNKKVKDTIEHYALNEVVKMHGFLPHHDAAKFYEECNVGVSFIPMIPCFKNQPPTKTYEYILSGLVCVGTMTDSNKTLINKENGVLHLDTPDDFYTALVEVYENRNHYCTQNIKDTLRPFLWRNIVNTILIPSLR